MPRARTSVAIAFLVLASLVACGSSARDKALRGTLLSVNAARDGFLEWNRRHELAIVEDATSLEDGRAKLAAYRAKADRVVAAFELAYRAIAVGALDGKTPLPTVLAVVTELVTAIADLKKEAQGP